MRTRVYSASGAFFRFIRVLDILRRKEALPRQGQGNQEHPRRFHHPRTPQRPRRPRDALLTLTNISG